jgi:prevent-host-death family protein
MSLVGVKELKNRLTHYLRRTQKGEEIVVTDPGRPIALLQQIEAGKLGTRRLVWRNSLRSAGSFSRQACQASD